MRIDSHQHFWKYDPLRDDWIDDSMEAIRRDFYPEELVRHLEEHHMDGCVAVQADQSEEETVFLLDLAEQNDCIKGVVGWVDLCADGAEERLAYFAQNPYFKGVRHIVQSEKEDFVLGDDFQNGISKLAPLHLTYDLLIFPHQIQNTIKLVDKFPNQMFILDHLAKPSIRTGEIEDWERGIIKLAEFPNVYCKLSGMVTEADWGNWKSEDFKPYFNTVFGAFGAERLVFGSDWPVCLLSGQYEDVLGLVESLIRELSQEKQEWIMGLNACNFYDLEGKIKSVWI